MVTLLNILERTSEYFAKAGIETPRVDAEWLMAHVLQCKRLDLYLQFERPLDEDVLERLRPLVKRRAKREPLQYILGEVEFHGIRLNVAPGVLIPRPETEELVELLLKQARTVAPASIVDLGTGSGALALALAQALPTSRVVAIDYSETALAQARGNSQHPGLDGRVDFRQGSWLEPLDEKVDWIVSNPPYLTEDEWTNAAPEVREYEPREALVAGNEGLADLLHIIARAPAHLNPGGLLALETGIAQHTRLDEAARRAGFVRCESHRDFNQHTRYWLGWVG